VALGWVRRGRCIEGLFEKGTGDGAVVLSASTGGLIVKMGTGVCQSCAPATKPVRVGKRRSQGIAGSARYPHGGGKKNFTKGR